MLHDQSKLVLPSWAPYDTTIAEKVEHAFQGFKKNTTLATFLVDCHAGQQADIEERRKRSGTNYEIDFVKMCQTNLRTARGRSIHRISRPKLRLLLCAPAHNSMFDRLLPAFSETYVVDVALAIAEGVQLAESNAYDCIVLKLAEGAHGEDVLEAVRSRLDRGRGTFIACYSYTASTTPSIRRSLTVSSAPTHHPSAPSAVRVAGLKAY